MDSANDEADNLGAILTTVVDAYWPALKTSLIQQGVIIVLAALNLDMGQAIHIAWVALVAHWGLITLIVCRRPTSPTRADLLLIRYGYIFMLFVVATAGPIWWTRVGRWPM